MSTPYLSEIRVFSFNFAPKGWALCNGQLLSINQNQALFALLGTTYGGDGRTNFALPNLQGRVPVHMDSGFVLGQQGGEVAHTLTTNELPAHAHTAQASTNTADAIFAANRALGGAELYAAPGNLTALEPTAIGNAGGSQPHTNMQPYLTLSFCIALTGLFPSQN